MTTASGVAGGPLARDSPYAGLATRAIAFVVDAIVIDIAAWLVGGAATVAASAFGIEEQTKTVLIVAGASVGILCSAGYFVFFWATTGQTPGCRLMEIRVRDAAADRPLSVHRAIVRLLAGILSALVLFLGYALVLVDDRRRGLHDRLARSLVVYAPKRSRPRR